MSNHPSLDSLIPSLAIKALMYEVTVSPKPGLVDRFNNGSHQDMNFYTFVDSVLSFQPFFKQYYMAGKELSHCSDLNQLFFRSREIGIQAEKAMFDATNGINTHKGANFSFALLLIGIGYLVEREQLTHWTPVHSDDLFNIIQLMTKDHLLKDFDEVHNKQKHTHGEKLYLQHGITGIRGEAVNGYPILKNILLPYFRSYAGELNEYILLKGLVLTMGHIEDGNIIYRGGMEAWQLVKQESLALFNEKLNPEEFLLAVHDYDQILIERHLSPGGAADALSLGIFLYLLESAFV
ncbi:triphosphoribosyl-dephospho-CoA synthase CitG [Fundicoccus culcitae]|uniref:Probable 2-(5''-triphosphoribosyl)-3'-dephosphocoenzyme-A synthase n=1 Tax=Fundicoccus culcitae TaxID=2969821 RepID=A0ABY5P438_9LACT|nr:triphosphoribosyl-dephospho-CoA synthase CitG [Fundicoccus culcitae]UUX33198.1 triphosphoribosyl-dephospho-CoA synthase CitG [Fundicoccus culcitae]